MPAGNIVYFYVREEEQEENKTKKIPHAIRRRMWAKGVQNHANNANNGGRVWGRRGRGGLLLGERFSPRLAMTHDQIWSFAAVKRCRFSSGSSATMGVRPRLASKRAREAAQSPLMLFSLLNLCTIDEEKRRRLARRSSPAPTSPLCAVGYPQAPSSNQHPSPPPPPRSSSSIFDSSCNLGCLINRRARAVSCDLFGVDSGMLKPPFFCQPPPLRLSLSFSGVPS